jgi:redox-sensitive bicupin YhaK (pirin superfamily)
VHFVQMWVVPDESGITPGYEQLEIDGELLAGGLVPVASGMARHDGAAAIRIANRSAALHAARLQPGSASPCPSARTCTCSSPAATSSSRGPAPSPRVTPSASPRPAVSD